MESLSLFQPTRHLTTLCLFAKHTIWKSLMEELSMSTMTGNPTYNLTAMSKDEILQNHHSVMLTFGISFPEEDIDLPKLYWIPKLHKNPYKKRYIAGLAKCSTKPLSQILTRIRPTGDQEVAGSTPAEVGNILSWRLIMKYFLRSFSPFRWFKKGSCQFLAKECAQYWLTA